jgi:enoyl-CoA hydratase/carnithine racemase
VALIEVSRQDAIGVCRLDRPEARNALSPELRAELAVAVGELDADEAIRCIVIAGNDEAFAAGADIEALRDAELGEMLGQGSDFWNALASCRTPLIAAVSGWALGGGCELALLCDMIVASETAQFGQPEINLGLIPGAGGTQRLARLVGKHKAMELVITGRRFDAREAEALGVVNRVAPDGEWMESAMELAGVVARRAPLAAKLAKQAVLAADESGLAAGLDAERRLFELAMATEDRVEGTTAFIEKRKPKFQGR